MLLTKIEYSEFAGDPHEWSLSATELNHVSLLVGKNASGKTRLLNIIASLAKLVTGGIPQLFQTGSYKAEFTDGATKFAYEIFIDKSNVVSETFSRDGMLLLDRKEGGLGQIYAEKLSGPIDFQSPTTVVAAYVKRDQVQHAFLETLYTWGTNLRHYNFGTSFGREQFLPMADFANEQAMSPEDPRTRLVAMVYKKAWDQFQEAFDRALIADMRLLGYDLGAVGVQPMNVPGVAPLFMGLYAQERDLKAPTTQITMSAGMFRALALVICLNDCVFRKLACTVLIDDVGEGLDFTRSRALVGLLVERAEPNRFQIIMTTNDRFVMNEVPLDYWGVVSRNSNMVRVINRQNSPEIFSKFEELGLNNFDFFSSEFFDSGFVSP